MSKFDFVPPLLEYVRGKAKSFLENHGVGYAYERIEQSANGNMTSVTDYINRLVNDTVSEVVNSENEEWDKISEEFTIHYFSKEMRM